MNRKLILGSIVLILCSLGLIWMLPEHPNTTETATTAQIAMQKMQWRVGSSQQYELLINSEMQMNSGANAMQGMNVDMQSMLDVRTLAVDSDSAVVGMQLSNVSLTVNGQIDMATNSALETPFRVHFINGALPATFEFPETLSTEHRGMLENTIRLFQVSVQGGDRWQQRESNSSGTYVADYVQVAPMQVQKHKRDFENLTTTPMFANAAIESEEVFELQHQTDWIANMTVKEVLRTEATLGPGMVVKNNASIMLLSVDQSLAANKQWNFNAADSAVEVNGSANAKEQMTAEEARQRILAALPRLDGAEKGRTSWIHQLRDLLRVDPSLPTLLIEQLKTQGFTDRTQADLYLVLELADTDASQTALTSVIMDPSWATKDNLRAIVALSGMENPTPETLDALWQTVEASDRTRIAGAATFALGALANTMQQNENPDYAQISQRLLGGATSGLETTKRVNYVYALGNTQDAHLSNDVAGLLKDKEPAIRRAAAQSLSLLDTDQHAQELFSQFNHENNSQVRGAIAETLVTWSEPTPQAMASIRNKVTNEHDENTRLQMARFLATNLEKFPENKSVLQNLLRVEQSKRVRQDVAEALAQANGINGRSVN